MTLGEKIKYYRTKNNYTQDYVGQCFHYTRQTISKWEQDKSMPNIDDIKKLADLFNIKVEDLLDIKENKTELDNKKNKRIKKLIIGITILCFILTIFIVFIVSKLSSNPNSKAYEYDGGIYITVDTNINVDYDGNLDTLKDYYYYFVRYAYIRSNFCNLEWATISGQRTIYLNALEHTYYIYLVSYDEGLNKYITKLYSILTGENSITAFLPSHNVDIVSTFGIESINVKTYLGVELNESYSVNLNEWNEELSHCIKIDGSMALIEIHLSNGTILNKTYTDTVKISYIYFGNNLISASETLVSFVN